jgi:dephospho-CoA kinase
VTTPTLRIGLTGGIASGKSAVASVFASFGIPVIDADLISRELVQPGNPALARIVEAFGESMLDPAGQLDRRRLREKVFADVAQRKRLEAILHPAIREELQQRSRVAGGPYQVLVIPLLVENGLQHLVDRILVVDVPEATQLARLKVRDSVTEEHARRVLAAQSGRDMRLAAADDVITNTGNLDDLRKQVDALHRKYLVLAAGRPGPA